MEAKNGYEEWVVDLHGMGRKLAGKRMERGYVEGKVLADYGTMPGAVELITYRGKFLGLSDDGCCPDWAKFRDCRLDAASELLRVGALLESDVETLLDRRLSRENEGEKATP